MSYLLFIVAICHAAQMIHKKPSSRKTYDVKRINTLHSDLDRIASADISDLDRIRMLSQFGQECKFSRHGCCSDKGIPKEDKDGTNCNGSIGPYALIDDYQPTSILKDSRYRAKGRSSKPVGHAKTYTRAMMASKFGKGSKGDEAKQAYSDWYHSSRHLSPEEQQRSFKQLLAKQNKPVAEKLKRVHFKIQTNYPLVPDFLKPRANRRQHKSRSLGPKVMSLRPSRDDLSDMSHTVTRAMIDKQNPFNRRATSFGPFTSQRDGLNGKPQTVTRAMIGKGTHGNSLGKRMSRRENLHDMSQTVTRGMIDRNPFNRELSLGSQSSSGSRTVTKAMLMKSHRSRRDSSAMSRAARKSAQTVTRAMMASRKDSSSDDMMDSVPRRKKGRRYAGANGASPAVFTTIQHAEPERSWMSRICLERLYWLYKATGDAWVNGSMINVMSNYHGWDLFKGKRNAFPKGKWVNIGDCRDSHVTRNLKTSRETCCTIFDDGDVGVMKYLEISGDTKMSAAKDSGKKIRALNEALSKLKPEELERGLKSVSVDSVASVLITSPNIQQAVANLRNGNRTNKWICDDPSQDFRQLKAKVVEMRLIALNDPNPSELKRALDTLKDLEAHNFAQESSSQNWTRSLAVAIARVLHEKWEIQERQKKEDFEDFTKKEDFEDFISRIIEFKSKVMADEMRRVYIASMEQKCRSKKMDYALINKKRTRGQEFDEKSLVDAVAFFEGLRKTEFFDWIDKVNTAIDAPLRHFDSRLAEELLKEGAQNFVIEYLPNYQDLKARVIVVRIGVPILTHFMKDPKVQKSAKGQSPSKYVYIGKDGDMGWRETVQAYLIHNKHIEDYPGLTKDMHAFFGIAGITPNSRFDQSYTIKQLEKRIVAMPWLQ